MSDHIPTLDAAYVEARWIEAGTALMALDVRGTRPAGYVSGWPDIVREAVEAYGYGQEQVRPQPPSARQITLMDEVFAWINFIPRDRYVLRRIVLVRALCNPLTGRQLYSWRRIGRLIGADHRAVQQWHGQGIDLIVRHLASS